MSEEWQPQKREMTEKEVRASAKRNIALGILPMMVRAHPDFTPVELVKRAFDIAEQMLEEGDRA